VHETEDASDDEPPHGAQDPEPRTAELLANHDAYSLPLTA
jgi:hypothetical protein